MAHSITYDNIVLFFLYTIKTIHALTCTLGSQKFKHGVVKIKHGCLQTVKVAKVLFSNIVASKLFVWVAVFPSFRCH